MIEAIFFADPGALKTSGHPEAMPVDFAPTCDPEDFQTSDTMYLAETAAACPCWSGLPRHRQKRLRPSGSGMSTGRAIQRAISSGFVGMAKPECTRYNQSSDGGKALAGLDWAAVMRRPAEQMQYISVHSWADLEDRARPGAPSRARWRASRRDTSRFTPRTRPVLRNL